MGRSYNHLTKIRFDRAEGYNGRMSLSYRSKCITEWRVLCASWIFKENNMLSPIGWLVVFAIACVLALVWAASNLSEPKAYIHNDIEVPHSLEFSSSLGVMFAIVLTIITS